MAETITLTYSAGSMSRSGSFPNGSGARFVAANKARLGLPANATNAEVFNAFADEMFRNIAQNAVNYERQQAATVAAAGVSDIPLT